MFNFTKKDTEFFDLFVESARYFYKGALLMDEVMQAGLLSAAYGVDLHLASDLDWWQVR